MSLLMDLSGWRMAGQGSFERIGPGVVETRGGSGLFWYADEVFDDFVLTVEWRVLERYDNSGVFIRSPPLLDDPQPAIDRGYEIQIDERGYNPRLDVENDALHVTGALYEIAPARVRSSRPIGEWNEFEIVAKADSIDVKLNGVAVSSSVGAGRQLRGHIALQTHHEGARVQFRGLDIRGL